MFLYYIRGLVGLRTVFGLLATLTYISPLINYLKKVGESPVIQRIGGRLIATKFTEEALRIALLPWCGMGKWYRISLTVIEITIFIYMEALNFIIGVVVILRALKTNQPMSEKQEMRK